MSKSKKVVLPSRAVKYALRYQALVDERSAIVARWDAEHHGTDEERARCAAIQDELERIASYLTWTVIHAVEGK